MKRIVLAAFLFLLAQAGYSTTPQSTAFTYQGNLSENNLPASGDFDLTFSLFNDATVGSQVGTTISMPAFHIANGTFTVDLDFPGVFTGNQLWLEVTVGTETLSPRQPVNAVPVAAFSLQGNAIAPAWNSATSYSQGALVTAGLASKTLFIARQANTNKTPGAVGNESYWAVVSTGTGASPVGIPYTMVTHQASSSEFFAPTTPAILPYTVSITPDVVTYIPTDCIASLTVYSLTGDSTLVTFSALSVTATASGFTFGGMLDASCTLTSTSKTVPATCSGTGTGYSAGSYVTIFSNFTPQTGTIFTAFSCY
jgi:hypothetical protein